MQLMPAGKCVAITDESAPLDGLMGQRLFQTETQIEFSIFQNGRSKQKFRHSGRCF